MNKCSKGYGEFTCDLGHKIKKLKQKNKKLKKEKDEYEKDMRIMMNDIQRLIGENFKLKKKIKK